MHVGPPALGGERSLRIPPRRILHHPILYGILTPLLHHPILCYVLIHQNTLPCSSTPFHLLFLPRPISSIILTLSYVHPQSPSTLFSYLSHLLIYPSTLLCPSPSPSPSSSLETPLKPLSIYDGMGTYMPHLYVRTRFLLATLARPRTFTRHPPCSEIKYTEEIRRYIYSHKRTRTHK